jgi:hypothetical protein
LREHAQPKPLITLAPSKMIKRGIVIIFEDDKMIIDSGERLRSL